MTDEKELAAKIARDLLVKCIEVQPGTFFSGGAKMLPENLDKAFGELFKRIYAHLKPETDLDPNS